MRLELNDFHETGVRIASGGDKTSFLEEAEEVAVELVTMTVTLGNLGGTINLLGERARLYFAVVCAQTHGSAL